MTRKIITPVLCFALALISCNNASQPATTAEGTGEKSMARVAGGSCEEYVAIDSANKMLLSYLHSVDFQNNDTDLRSMVFDAACLRDYLSNANVASVKVMFAHTLDYINNGGQDQPAGYRSGKLTLVIAGYDRSGNYVFSTQGNDKMVLDLAAPCPHNCPQAGTAAADSLQ